MTHADQIKQRFLTMLQHLSEGTLTEEEMDYVQDLVRDQMHIEVETAQHLSLRS